MEGRRKPCTLTQRGGTIVVGSNPGNGFAYVGQLGTGVFNLSGGTFKSATFSIGEGTGASGTVNQTGGTIDNCGRRVQRKQLRRRA